VCWFGSCCKTSIPGDNLGRSKVWVDVVHIFTGVNGGDNEGTGLSTYCRFLGVGLT
ncbi:unnamed protein product, partial [Adineta steineri]